MTIYHHRFIIDLSSFGEEYSVVTSRPSSIALELPSKNLIKVTSQDADARNLNVRNRVAILAPTIQAGGGDLNQVTLSVASGSRQRRKDRREIFKRIRNSFVKPEHISVHWDTKLVKINNYIEIIIRNNCIHLIISFNNFNE